MTPCTALIVLGVILLDKQSILPKSYTHTKENPGKTNLAGCSDEITVI